MPDNFYLIEHEITVARLKELLLQLEDTDILIPNRVRNLLIVRGGYGVGAVNPLEGSNDCGILG